MIYRLYSLDHDTLTIDYMRDISAPDINDAFTEFEGSLTPLELEYVAFETSSVDYMVVYLNGDPSHIIAKAEHDLAAADLHSVRDGWDW